MMFTILLIAETKISNLRERSAAVDSVEFGSVSCSCSYDMLRTAGMKRWEPLPGQCIEWSLQGGWHAIMFRHDRIFHVIVMISHFVFCTWCSFRPCQASVWNVARTNFEGRADLQCPDGQFLPTMLSRDSVLSALTPHWLHCPPFSTSFFYEHRLLGKHLGCSFRTVKELPTCS